MSGEDSGEPCGGCTLPPSPTLPVTWSPAFAAYLCAPCRVRRTDAELGATERDNAAARMTARRRDFAARFRPARRG